MYTYKLNDGVLTESLHFRKNISYVNKTILLKNAKKSSLVLCHYTSRLQHICAVKIRRIYISYIYKGKITV